MNFYLILLISSLFLLNTLLKIAIMMITESKTITLKTTSPKLMKKSSAFTKWPKRLSLSHCLITGD